MKMGIGKKYEIIALFMAMVMLMGLAFPASDAKAATGEKGYLLLIEDQDGAWNSYENYVEVATKDALMVQAAEAAKLIGIKYKKVNSKIFSISNGNKVNTYTNGSVKYKYTKGSKAVTKKAVYKSYLSSSKQVNMVEFSTLASLVNVKYYTASKAGAYKDAGYLGVICISKYNRITKLPDMEEGVRVTTEAEFVNAAADPKISVINVITDITLSEDVSYIREENGVTVNIKKGKTLTINKSYLGVGGSIVNNGTIIIIGSFERGICNLDNKGTVIVKNGGSVLSGMSDLNNNGCITIEEGAHLDVTRGSQVYNYGKLSNEGKILIDDGGSFQDKGGTLENNGLIDINSYYEGDITLITGKGTVNDNRTEK